MVLPLFTHTHGHQNDNGDYIGQNLIELAGKEGDLEAHIEDHKGAEENGAPDGTHRPPQAEDDQSHGQPALSGETLVVPDTAGDGHDIDHAADGGDPTANDGGQILIAGNVDAGSIGGGGGLSHRAQVESRPAVAQKPGHAHGDDHAHIDEDVIAKDQRSHHRELPEGRRKG